tara:strand:- start:1952 stop:2884 length:933 start_codon:yes stop_codon:yes gene_type:complete
MKTLLFPGQGSQKIGMGLDFYNNFKIVKDIFSEADQTLNFKLSKIILEGPNDKLILTQNTQPAIMTVSYSIFKVLENEFGLKNDKFNFFVGHSLGEYSALVCAKSLIFKDALFLLRERGLSMQNAVPVGEGAMLAVLGKDISEVKKLISEIKSNEILEIANDNAPGQIIISGTIKAINEIQSLFKVKKIKSIKLPVSAPFHCSLMKKASEEMGDKIKSIEFKPLTNQIVSNVNALPQNDPNKIKELLIEQIFSTVKWRESIEFINKQGTESFIEIGPGKVLSGMTKRIARNAKIINIDTLNDLESFKNEF